MEIDEAYRCLKNCHAIEVQCVRENLLSLIENMENIGFVAITIKGYETESAWLTLKAYKGKAGPCYDTGISVTYTGAAIAVLDDDDHWLPKGAATPVCEKTAKIYIFKEYADTVKVSAADEELVKRLELSPKPFMCDDLGVDVESLRSTLPSSKAQGERVALFYAGPFKLLVLPDGSLLKRGRVNEVVEEYARALCQEGCLEVSDTQDDIFRSTFHDEFPDNAELPNFPDGKSRVNSTPQISKAIINHSPDSANWSELKGLNKSLRKKLIHCIETQQEFLMLSGSDPEEEQGCCPSEDVGVGNRLVRAGIMCSYYRSGTQGSCPMGMFAFRGELLPAGEDVEHKIDPVFRRDFQSHLKRLDRGRVLRKIAAVFFIGLMLISIAVSLVKYSHSSIKNQQPLDVYLDLADEQKTAFVLFHRNTRCEQCLKMEKFTIHFLRKHHSDDIEFHLINMDDTAHESYIEFYDLFSTTMMMISWQGEQANIRIIKDAWETWVDEERFQGSLLEAIEQSSRHE
ncbi:MAG: hypothetical protein HQL32_10285 [Planctomycetes bacterium]|nr:hypothetical protein [Planctomycetota bacterium]